MTVIHRDFFFFIVLLCITSPRTSRSVRPLISFHALRVHDTRPWLLSSVVACEFCMVVILSRQNDTHAVDRGAGKGCRDEKKKSGRRRIARTWKSVRSDKSSFARRIINFGCSPFPRTRSLSLSNIRFFPSRAFSRFPLRQKKYTAPRKRNGKERIQWMYNKNSRIYSIKKLIFNN